MAATAARLRRACLGLWRATRKRAQMPAALTPRAVSHVIASSCDLRLSHSGGPAAALRDGSAPCDVVSRWCAPSGIMRCPPWPQSCVWRQRPSVVGLWGAESDTLQTRALCRTYESRLGDRAERAPGRAVRWPPPRRCSPDSGSPATHPIGQPGTVNRAEVNVGTPVA